MPPKFRIHHWGANLPPIRTRNQHKREIHFRACLIALALSGLAIGSFAMAITKASEHPGQTIRAVSGLPSSHCREGAE